MVDAVVDSLQPEDFFDLTLTPHLRTPEQLMRYFHALGSALRGREDAA